MATLRVKFPEKPEPSTLVLSGSRVTLGRLPLNTIQIIDRTLSGFHAEFVLEEDHYRLHDRGSTNGTFVNGETVNDFHLREACKISFGSLECEYSPESPASTEAANLEALPTRSEINAVRQENAELKAKIESLKAEVETLTKAQGSETGVGTIAVERMEYDKLVAERDSLKEAQGTTAQKIEQLQAELAHLQRDRESLQRVADSAKAEIAGLNTPAATPPKAPPAEAPAEPVVAPSAPAPEPAAPAASTPPAPVAPSVLPKPSFPLPTAKPLAKPATALPTAPVPTPIATGGVPRPVARPILPPSAVPAAPVSAPAAALKPLPRPLPKPPTSAMKGGTQKLDGEAAAKPVEATPRPTLKPPMKLPLQPTVRLQPGQKPTLPPTDNGGK